MTPEVIRNSLQHLLNEGSELFELRKAMKGNEVKQNYPKQIGTFFVFLNHCEQRVLSSIFS